MAFRPITDPIDLETFIDALKAQVVGPPARGVLIEVDFPGTFELQAQYWDEQGKLLCPGVITNGGTSRGQLVLDASLQFGDSPNSLVHDAPSVTNQWNFFCDQIDPDTSQQAAYIADATVGGTDIVRTFDPSNGSIGGVAAFTGPNGSLRKSTNSHHIASTSAGGYAQATHYLIFTGWTDGAAGITNLVGTGVYPDGIAVTTLTDGTLATSGDADGCLGYVDINRIELVGCDPTIPGRATSSPGTGLYTEPPVFGLEFDWIARQFIADPDSTPGAPKGEIMLQSEGSFITDSGTADVCIIRFVEFNPLAVVATPGNPVRTHGRYNVTSQIEFNVDPIYNVGGAGDGYSNQWSVWYDPPNQRIIHILRDKTVSTPGAATSMTGVCIARSYARTVLPVTASSPRSREIHATNSIVAFESFAQGSLGELVGGTQIDFTLTRRSTRDEALTTTFPGGFTLANGPVDDDPDGAADLQIYADGVLLAVTTDYTITQSTGVGVWVTDQSSAVVVVAHYKHRETSATPAHGTLLNANAVTDGDGVAVARVQYPDSDILVGELDHLDAALA